MKKKNQIAIVKNALAIRKVENLLSITNKLLKKGLQKAQKEIQDLNKNEKQELRNKYRKAAFLCHPHAQLSNHAREQGKYIFIELNDAYAKADLARVTEILKSLENGIIEDGKSDSIP